MQVCLEGTGNGCKNNQASNSKCYHFSFNEVQEVKAGQVLKCRAKLQYVTQQDQGSVPVRLCRVLVKIMSSFKSVENKIRISTKIPLLCSTFKFILCQLFQHCDPYR